MSITVNDFAPSVNILGSDSIANTDDKLRTIIGEAGDYLETETQNAVTQMENAVNEKLNELASVDDATYTAVEVDERILAHANNTSNPHAVTKAQVGLSNVDNTSDLNKPVSTAMQNALNLKAPLNSPTFSGNVTNTGGRIETGVGSGSVAMTVNDGRGNANITFNHANGIPDADGSSARITSTVDDAIGVIRFQIADNVTAGVSSTISTPFALTKTNAQFFVPITGASFNGITSIATAAEIRAGANNTKAITPLGFYQTSFGMGQNYRIVTASRSAGVDYYNTSGKGIFVLISCGSGNFGFVVNDETVLTFAYGGCCFIPAGAKYKVTADNTIIIWAELAS